MSVTWVLNGDGEYEISSAEHLKQLMNKGMLYIDGGSPPTEYWTSNYKQTADIDLLGVSTDIKPIGVVNDEYSGTYDGGEFSISNWSYLDPQYPNRSNCEYGVGLFGRIDNNTVLKNIRINGLCILKGSSTAAGFLVGDGSLAISGTQFINVVVDLEDGSEIDQGVSSTQVMYVGGVVGRLGTGVAATNISIRGSLDFPEEANGAYIMYTGGVFGFSAGVVSVVENQATFPSGVHGHNVGGIIGFNRGPISMCINAMVGDISGTNSVGGILGSTNDTTNSVECHTLINAMTGNIVSTATNGCGGIIGRYRGTPTVHTLINYMSGDISGSSGSNGGIFGLITNGDVTISSSINAMNGGMDNTVLGENSPSVFLSDVTVDASFGLTFTGNNTYSTTTPPTGLLTDSGFTNLPYTSIAGTDTDGNSYDFDFVYANLAGNNSYSNYTHLILHKDVIHTPYTVNFSVPTNSSTLYLTYVNAGTRTVLQDALQITLEAGTWELSVRSINILVGIGPVTGASSYRLTYQGPGGPEVTAFSGFTGSSKNIVNLDPGTQYVIRLYADTGNGYEVTQDFTTTTLANDPSNYVVTDFEDNGVFDLTRINETTRTEISSVMDALFDTGDLVNVSVDAAPDLNTSFIKLGESLNIKEISGLLLPFDGGNGAGQDVTVVLSDDSTNVPVTYDETSNTINVNSNVYSPGDVFILDGKKVSVQDY